MSWKKLNLIVVFSIFSKVIKGDSLMCKNIYKIKQPEMESVLCYLQESYFAKVKLIYTIGYGTSLAFLTIAVGILLLFR